MRFDNTFTIICPVMSLPITIIKITKIAHDYEKKENRTRFAHFSTKMLLII